MPNGRAWHNAKTPVMQVGRCGELPEACAKGRLVVNTATRLELECPGLSPGSYHIITGVSSTVSCIYLLRRCQSVLSLTAADSLVCIATHLRTRVYVMQHRRVLNLRVDGHRLRRWRIFRSSRELMRPSSSSEFTFKNPAMLQYQTKNEWTIVCEYRTRTVSLPARRTVKENRVKKEPQFSFQSLLRTDGEEVLPVTLPPNLPSLPRAHVFSI